MLLHSCIFVISLLLTVAPFEPPPWGDQSMGHRTSHHLLSVPLRSNSETPSTESGWRWADAVKDEMCGGGTEGAAHGWDGSSCKAQSILLLTWLG